MIQCVRKALGAEVIELRINISLQSEHVGRRELLVRTQHLIDSLRSIGRFPFNANGIGISVTSDAPISSCQNARWRIEDGGQLFERDIANPLMFVIATGDRKSTRLNSSHRCISY